MVSMEAEWIVVLSTSVTHIDYEPESLPIPSSEPNFPLLYFNVGVGVGVTLDSKVWSCCEVAIL